ncbi:PepSY-associated TM helix domain-containing protein [Kordiimonas aestuarii]|uniref:PepSY-associated TM helix domain-containing protein n=1 Tax=Kordiimonas aestuarii TaxID=1005925 RepID=UPI0021D25663|nr:PepSY-associated TM helix domain-containing protein [Kordiimonas aestuarii]
MGQTVSGKQPKKRSLWWVVHHWAGLKVSLFLTFILATGTLATLSHEIDWLMIPEMRAESENLPPASWGQMYDSAKAAVPEGRIERISAPYDFFFAAEAIALDSSGNRIRVQINPYSADVQGVTSWFNAQRLFRELHRHLMVPVKVGLPFVAILSVPMLASLVTAFWVYKKWWRGFFRLPRLRLPGRGKRMGDARRFTGDLHRFAGLWSLWFIAVIGVTGLWYLVEWGGGGAPGALKPVRNLPVAALDGDKLDRLVTSAQAAYPTLHVTSLYFPNNKRGGVVVMGQADAVLMRERANAVLVDPETGQVVQIQKGEDLSVHQRIAEGSDPLHFGTWAQGHSLSFGVRLLWFAFGAILTGLGITGVMIFSMRLKPADRPAKITEPGFLGDMWRGMGRFRIPALLLALLGLAMAAYNISVAIA